MEEGPIFKFKDSYPPYWSYSQQLINYMTQQLWQDDSEQIQLKCILQESQTLKSQEPSESFLNFLVMEQQSQNYTISFIKMHLKSVRFINHRLQNAFQRNSDSDIVVNSYTRKPQIPICSDNIQNLPELLQIHHILKYFPRDRILICAKESDKLEIEVKELIKHKDLAYAQIHEQAFEDSETQGALKLMEHLDFELDCLRCELREVINYDIEVPPDIHILLQNNLEKNFALQWLIKMLNKFQSLRVNIKKTTMNAAALLTFNLFKEQDLDFFMDRYSVDYQRARDKLHASSLNMNILCGYFQDEKLVKQSVNDDLQIFETKLLRSQLVSSQDIDHDINQEYLENVDQYQKSQSKSLDLCYCGIF